MEGARSVFIPVDGAAPENLALLPGIKEAVAIDDRFEFKSIRSVAAGGASAAASDDALDCRFVLRTSRAVRPATSKENPVGALLEAESIPQYLWPAAPPFARWLLAHRELLAGRRVLELGSGAGLAGWAAVCCGARLVALTDCSVVALAMLSNSVAANQDALRTAECAAHVALLRWGHEAQVEALLAHCGIDAFDVVIGCDIFYFRSSLDAGLKTAVAALRGRAGATFLCGSVVRSERMEEDLATVPSEQFGLLAGEETCVKAPATDDANVAKAENALRIFRWTVQ